MLFGVGSITIIIIINTVIITEKKLQIRVRHLNNIPLHFLCKSSNVPGLSANFEGSARIGVGLSPGLEGDGGDGGTG